MKKTIIKTIILTFLSLTSCKTGKTKNYTYDIDSASRNVIEIISHDFIGDNFKNSNVILVEIDKEFEKGNLIFKISEDKFVQSFSVMPDTVDFYINSYIEKNDKLFLFHGSKNVKKPSQVYSKIQSYGVSLDSCFMKYQYLNPDPVKFSECFYNNEKMVLFDTSNSVYLLATRNERNGQYEIFNSLGSNGSD